MRKSILLFACFLFLNSVFAQQTTTRIFRYENKTRPFIIHTPPGYDGTQRLPLVINMHGFLMNGKWQMNYTQMNKTADLENFIVVYPYGVNRRWNTGTFAGSPH